MDWKDYEEICGRLGYESEEAETAYRDACINDILQIAETIRTDDFGDVIVTFKNRSDITTEEMLGWIDWFQNHKGIEFNYNIKQLKIRVY